MWYEKSLGIIGINFIVFSLIILLLWFTQTNLLLCSMVIMLLIAFINTYDIYIAYNRGIDNTIKYLGKHYEEKLMGEVNRALKRLQSI